MAATTFSAKDLAGACGTDARTVRKFLRHHLPQDEHPGQGGRYAFTKGEVTKLTKAFGSWAAGKAAEEATEAKPAKAKKVKKGEVDADLTVDPTNDETIDLEDLDPEDEEIEDIEDLDLVDEDT